MESQGRDRLTAAYSSLGLNAAAFRDLFFAVASHFAKNRFPLFRAML